MPQGLWRLRALTSAAAPAAWQKFAAIRRASSRESSLAADRRPRLFFVIDVGKGLAV